MYARGRSATGQKNLFLIRFFDTAVYTRTFRASLRLPGWRHRLRIRNGRVAACVTTHLAFRGDCSAKVPTALHAVLCNFDPTIMSLFMFARMLDSGEWPREFPFLCFMSQSMLAVRPRRSVRRFFHFFRGDLQLKGELHGSHIFRLGRSESMYGYGRLKRNRACVYTLSPGVQLGYGHSWTYSFSSQSHFFGMACVCTVRRQKHHVRRSLQRTIL